MCLVVKRTNDGYTIPKTKRVGYDKRRNRARLALSKSICPIVFEENSIVRKPRTRQENVVCEHVKR